MLQLRQKKKQEAIAKRKLLISELEDEHVLTGLTAPEGAAEWTDEQITSYFESDGEVLPE